MGQAILWTIMRLMTIERNDQSFIYVMEMAGRIPRGVRLYPTLIRGCHASLAEGVYALNITEKMAELCAAFHTPTLLESRATMHRNRILAYGRAESDQSAAELVG